MPTVFESYSLINPMLLHSRFHLLTDNYLQMILLSYTTVRVKKKTKESKTCGPNLLVGFTSFKAAKPLLRDSFLVSNKFASCVTFFIYG